MDAKARDEKLVFCSGIMKLIGPYLEQAVEQWIVGADRQTVGMFREEREEVSCEVQIVLNNLLEILFDEIQKDVRGQMMLIPLMVHLRKL